METYDLGVQTHHLGVLAQNEAVAVRVVTFLALVYLPSTVVSVSINKTGLSLWLQAGC